MLLLLHVVYRESRSYFVSVKIDPVSSHRRKQRSHPLAISKAINGRSWFWWLRLQVSAIQRIALAQDTY
jgi:hypothetical protein